jgi:hypothetical protein
LGGLDWKMLMNLMSIGNILPTFEIVYDHLVYFVFIWYIFPVLESSTTKNLATLLEKDSFDCQLRWTEMVRGMFNIWYNRRQRNCIVLQSWHSPKFMYKHFRKDTSLWNKRGLTIFLTEFDQIWIRYPRFWSILVQPESCNSPKAFQFSVFQRFVWWVCEKNAQNVAQSSFANINA